MAKTIGGVRSLQINGRTYPLKGSWTIDMGGDMREAIVGSDGVHGFKETPTVPYIEGAMSLTDEMDLKELKATKDATVVLELRNNTAVVLRGAWAAGDFQHTTEESEVAARFEAMAAEGVKL